MYRALLVGLLGVLIAQPSWAQPTLGVYFDPQGTKTSREIFTYPADFTFYVVAKGVEDFKSLEFALDYDTSGVRNVWWGSNGGYDLLLPGATNLCEQPWKQYCIGVSCTTGPEPVVIASVTLQAFDAVQDYTICVQATSTGSGPGYTPCDGSTLDPLLAPYQGCAVVNPVTEPTPVRASARSWGQVKALFGN
jgi:hypothetical protein